MALMLLASSLLLVCYLARCAYWWHRLRHIPGPLWTSFRSGCSWTLKSRSLSSRHGGLIRVGPNQLITSDIDSILRINSQNSGYSRNSPPSCPSQGHRVFSCPGGKKYTRQANPCGYTGDSHMEAVVDRQCNRLIRWIEDELGSTKGGFKTLEMAPASRWLMSNILGDLVAGEPCASLEEGQGRCNISRAERNTFSRLLAAVLPVRALRGPGFHDEHDWTRSRLDTSTSDVDEEEIKGEPYKLGQWGHLTADALTAIVNCLLSSPAIYNRLKVEIESAVVAGSPPPSTPSTPGAISPMKMPYLQVVVKEGSRMSDAATTLPQVFRKSPNEIDNILGFRIPAGTEVAPDLFGILRGKKYWGGDAEVFRPDRWLEANDEKSRLTMESALGIVWGNMGSTNGHPARAAAEMVLSKILALMFSRFDISLTEPHDAINPGRAQSGSVCFVPASKNDNSEGGRFYIEAQTRARIYFR